MRLKLLFMLLLLALPLSAVANTIYFSQVAFGGGFSTTFVIINTGTTPISGTLTFFSQSGASRGDLNSPMNIPVGGSARYVVPNSGPLTVVWAQFAAGSGKAQGVATFDFRNSAGTLSTSAGVLGVEGGVRFMVPVDVTQTGATGLAVNNASTVPLNLSLRLYDESGALAMTSTDTRFLPLGARAQAADFVTSIFPQLAGTTFRGSLVIEAPAGTATGALAATALIIKEGMLAGLPVIGSDEHATTLEFPQVAFGGGYTTTLTLVNTSTVLAAGTLRFFAQSGAPRTDLTANIAIPASGSVRQTLPDVGSLTAFTGEFVATSGTVQGTTLFESRAQDGTLITVAGIPAVQPGNGYRLPVDISTTASTGIAVANANSANLNLSYRLLREDGTDVPIIGVDSSYTSFGARNQFADFSTSIFPQVVNFRGALSIEADPRAPANSVAAAALTVKEGLLSALPVIPDTLSSCKLPEAANRGDVGLGFPRYFRRMPTTGTVHVKVLFVDFSDAPATQTPQQVFAVISPGAQDFYAAVSYGRLQYQLDPYLTWIRMSKPSTGYGWANLTSALHQAYIQEAVTLADPNVDFSTSDMVAVMANPSVVALTNGPAFTGNGYTADGKTFYNGVTSGADLKTWGYKWLNHEAGHTMGLVDLYAFSGDTHRFVGGFSMMGLISGNAPEYLAYERWLLGWLDDAQISCQTSNDSTVLLTPIEQSGGLKALMVPIGPASLLVVESRRTIENDRALTKTGALVYTVDSSVLSGSGPIQIFPNNSDKYQSVLAAGESVTVGKVTVTVTQSTAEGDAVRVTAAP